MGKLGKKARQKLLANVCLHCGFFKLHKDKWPDWKPTDEAKKGDAFQDMVHSATEIVAEIFSMLDESGRMKFFENVELSVKNHELFDSMKGKPVSLKEFLEKFGISLGDKKPPEPIKH
jgi:hypothetical protein